MTRKWKNGDSARKMTKKYNLIAEDVDNLKKDFENLKKQVSEIKTDMSQFLNNEILNICDRDSVDNVITQSQEPTPSSEPDSGLLLFE